MSFAIPNTPSRKVVFVVAALAAVWAVGAFAVASVVASPLLVTVVGSGTGSSPSAPTATEAPDPGAAPHDGGGCHWHHWG